MGAKASKPSNTAAPRPPPGECCVESPTVSTSLMLYELDSTIQSRSHFIILVSIRTTNLPAIPLLFYCCSQSTHPRLVFFVDPTNANPLAGQAAVHWVTIDTPIKNNPDLKAIRKKFGKSMKLHILFTDGIKSATKVDENKTFAQVFKENGDARSFQLVP